MAWLSRKVMVVMIDDATDSVFAKSKLPPADLPETFEIETTLHLGEHYWAVVEAVPRTREECSQSGTLTLRLRKIEQFGTEEISYSQLDITEGFDDNRGLSNDEWISTTPLNISIPDPESVGLPGLDADAEEVYRLASDLSTLRESISIPDDGVYCPVCHIANVNLEKLRTPCPKCGRELLKFGWT